MATPITRADFDALSFGYLTGYDLSQWCAFQFLQVEYAKNPTGLQISCNTAINEITKQLNGRYDMSKEYVKTGTARDLTCVKISAIKAIQNILGGNQYLNDTLKDLIAENNRFIKDIRNGQIYLDVVQKEISNPLTGSVSYLAADSFGFLS
jgi:hypothetical protein